MDALLGSSGRGKYVPLLVAESSFPPTPRDPGLTNNQHRIPAYLAAWYRDPTVRGSFHTVRQDIRSLEDALTVGCAVLRSLEAVQRREDRRRMGADR